MPQSYTRYSGYNGYNKKKPKKQYSQARESYVRLEEHVKFTFTGLFGRIDPAFISQLLGLGILSIALLLAFQNFSSGLSTSVKATEEQSVRLYTNFNSSQVGDSRVSYNFQPLQPTQPSTTDQNAIDSNQIVPEAAATQDRFYIVKQGDTINSIALLLGIETNTIVTKNNLQDPSSLRVGQKLLI